MNTIVLQTIVFKKYKQSNSTMYKKGDYKNIIGFFKRLNNRELIRMKFCKHCDKQVNPSRKFSFIWFILITICTIGWGFWIYPAYYLLFKSTKCPICGGNTFLTDGQYQKQESMQAIIELEKEKEGEQVSPRIARNSEEYFAAKNELESRIREIKKSIPYVNGPDTHERLEKFMQEFSQKYSVQLKAEDIVLYNHDDTTFKKGYKGFLVTRDGIFADTDEMNQFQGHRGIILFKDMLVAPRKDSFRIKMLNQKSDIILGMNFVEMKDLSQKNFYEIIKLLYEFRKNVT